MSATYDELAGVVDLFGGLTRTELSRALVEIGARRGDEPDEDAVADTIGRAIEAYYLVRYESDRRDDLLVAGPAAFPTLPDHADDLPHIMDVEPRSLDREALGRQTAARLRDGATAAIEDGDADRLRTLREVTYDAEAWAPVALDDLRDRIDAALADGGE